VIYIPVYTVVQLQSNQYFGKMIASLHDETIILPFLDFMITLKNYLLKKDENKSAIQLRKI
jgi:ABC-type iron transport system FetAB permease component